MDYINNIKLIINHSKNYGFIFPSSEIYNGFSSIYDYGHYGVLLKNNIKKYWWNSMIKSNENIVGIDSSIIMHPKVWISSGHVNEFNDFFIKNNDSKLSYRVDFLIENHVNKLNEKSIYKKNKILEKFYFFLEKKDLNNIDSLIKKLSIKEPITNSKNWGNVEIFNLMFKTKCKSSGDNDIYLRPETAQGIFINFSNIQKTNRLKLPFGVAQIGKVFRNEIIARQFIFRMREFEQMEMQFFIEPGKENKWYEYWKFKRLKWHLDLGVNKNFYRFKKHEKLAHYTNFATDIEFMFPFGFKELEGIHSRTDFDIKKHEKLSNKKLKYFDSKKNISYIPYVIETSIGLDRMFLAIISSSLKEEKINNDNNNVRVVMKLPKILSPIKAAILPLVKKNGLAELGKKIFNSIKWNDNIIYEENESIGKRYRRQDAIGTPLCITIDYESLLNETVTVRFRDDMSQKRIKIKNIENIINDETNINFFLKKNNIN